MQTAFIYDCTSVLVQLHYQTLAPKNPQQPSKPTNPNPPQQSTYNCQADGAAVLAAGTVFGVIAVMSAGTAPVIVAAAWGGIALWGGTATGVWGLGHAVACGF